MDKQEVTFLILLDMLFAHGTVSHDLLLERLSAHCGIKGKSLDWISSYHKGRRQAVNINGNLSDELTLDCGVPQGSVSGPLYYLIYTRHLGDTIRKDGLNTMSMQMITKTIFLSRLRMYRRILKDYLCVSRTSDTGSYQICSEIME